jgi:hypothetical protein
MAGKLYRLVQFVETRRTSFTVARLIMMTGVPLREQTETTPDDPQLIAKVDHALAALLTPEELSEARQLQ